MAADFPDWPRDYLICLRAQFDVFDVMKEFRLNEDQMYEYNKHGKYNSIAVPKLNRWNNAEINYFSEDVCVC